MAADRQYNVDWSAAFASKPAPTVDQWYLWNISAYRLELVPAGQAMAEPLAEKQVQLSLFVGLVHIGVGVGINTAEAPGVFGTDDFGHARVVIDLHFQYRHRQPGQAVLLTHLQRGGVRTIEDDLDRQHAEHLIALGDRHPVRTLF